MPEKTQVFVAHSFEKTPPQGESMSDQDVAEWFIKLMRNKPVALRVVTGSKPSPGTAIDEKIKTAIADSSCIIGIFTKRHHERGRNAWLPSQFVLCECACAIGFYYNTNKLICGFYEEGIEPRDLALITIGGLDLVSFRRGDLDKDKQRFIDYLKRIPEILAVGSPFGQQVKMLRPPYVQQRLWKIYTIYRNGSVTVQNINRMLVTDAEKFNLSGATIRHEIWTRDRQIPPLADMMAESIDQRKDRPFLSALFRSINQRKINKPLEIRPFKNDGCRAYFDVHFAESDGRPVSFKNQDILEYQYAWGLPGAYATREEDLDADWPGEQVNEKAYNEAEVFSAHGPIEQLVLELRFEKGKGEIFSKSPFFQALVAFGDSPPWTSPELMPLIDADDHEMYFQSFELVERNFQGKIRVLWRPSGRTVANPRSRTATSSRARRIVPMTSGGKRLSVSEAGGQDGPETAL